MSNAALDVLKTNLESLGQSIKLNEDKELVFKQEYGYVPNKLIPPKDGFDDYVDLEIDREGKITNWYENPFFEDFDLSGLRSLRGGNETTV